jgi:hypothetical protein
MFAPASAFWLRRRQSRLTFLACGRWPRPACRRGIFRFPAIRRGSS